MPKNPLFDLYEKLYFHEIEVREKLGGRLQTPMAIIVSLIGVLAFLIQNFDKEHGATSAIADQGVRLVDFQPHQVRFNLGFAHFGRMAKIVNTAEALAR